MRPPFGPRGPPFDPREGDAFFRLPFDDARGPPGGLMRPPFGPPGPPISGAEPPWRNSENGPPPGSWSPMESSGNGHDSDERDQLDERESHVTRDNKKNSHKSQDSKSNDRLDRERDREARNRNRKSRWGNVSPPPADHIDVTMSENDCEDDGKVQLDRAFDTSDNNSQSFNDNAEPSESVDRVEQYPGDEEIADVTKTNEFEVQESQSEITNHHTEDETTKLDTRETFEESQSFVEDRNEEVTLPQSQEVEERNDPPLVREETRCVEEKESEFCRVAEDDAPERASEAPSESLNDCHQEIDKTDPEDMGRDGGAGDLGEAGGQDDETTIATTEATL